MNMAILGPVLYEALKNQDMYLAERFFLHRGFWLLSERCFRILRWHGLTPGYVLGEERVKMVYIKRKNRKNNEEILSCYNGH